MGTPVPNYEIEKAAEIKSDVKTYHMTPEEIAAKYGPPVHRKENNQFHAQVIQAVKVSDSPEQAADLLNISVGRLNQYLGSREIYPNWGKKPETEADDVLRSNKSRIEELKEKLSKAQYLAFKESKLSDRVILKKIGYDDLSWLAPLSSLKKEWGLSGMKVIPDKDLIYPGEKSDDLISASAIAQFLGKLGEALACNVRNTLDKTLEREEELYKSLSPYGDYEDDEVIAWATSRKPVNQTATIRVHEKGAALNSHALREMAGIKAVNVGITKKGILVIQQGSGPGTYTIGKTDSPESKGSSAKIGGGSLAKFLVNHGVKPGKYPLVRNEAKDRWEADVRQGVS